MNQLDIMQAASGAQLAASFQRVVDQARIQNTAAGCCQGGSQIVPSQQEKIWITGSAICAVLGAAWTPLAGALCEVLVPILLDLGPICSQCPPAPVAPPFDQVFATGLLPTPNQVLDWATSTFVSQNWNTWCQCIGGAGCGQTPFTITTGGNQYGEQNGWATHVPLPDAPDGVTMPFSWSNVPAGIQFTPQIGFFRADGSAINYDNMPGGLSNYSASYVKHTGLQQANPGMASFGVRMIIQSGTLPTSWTATITGTATWENCTNPVSPYTPPAVIPPPADIPPPPPLPTGCTLDQICQKVTYTETMLDNISRFLDLYLVPPHSWSEGAIHAGLSGNGAFNLFSNTRGLRALVTTLPNRAGSNIGNPNRLFDVGWITAGGAEGPYATWDIEHSPQVWTLPLPSSSVSFSIPADVVVTLTELVQGP